MRFFLFPYFLAISISSFAQIPNRTETNCAGFERNIYQIGDLGKTLIVASKGLDCSICMNSAPAVGAFASEHIDQIEVWGAMSNLYNPAEPTCSGVGNWEQTYAWSNVFAFRDLEGYWVGQGFPTYYVIHPITREIIYEGGNWNTATTAALGVTLGIEDTPSLADAVTVFASDAELNISLVGAKTGSYEMEIFDIAGHRVATFETSVFSDRKNFKIPFSEREGIYILRIDREGELAIKKFLLVR